MKKIVIAIILVVLFITFLSCKEQNQNENTVEESFEATPVKVHEVKKSKISEKLFYTGIIEAWKKINVTPDIGGKVVVVHVNEGDRVQKGQLLAELDTQAVRLQLKQAEAVLAVTESNWKDAKLNMDRMERLRRENAVSEQQYEKIKLAYEASEAQLEQAKAALNLVRHNLNVSLMKAPFSGIVASRNAEVGEVINPMMGGISPSSGVLTLMDFSRVKIKIDISPRDIVRVQKNQRAELRVDAFPGQIFEGHVAIVNQAADPLTKKFRIEVWVNNPDLVLKPNTFGEVVLEVSTHANALVIPQKAVLENKFVLVAQENVAVRKDVILGLQNSDKVEVIKGLKEGELVIVEGNFGLEDGAKIHVKEVL